MLSNSEIEELNASLQHSSPAEVLARACELFPDTAISFSGAEDVVLIELASRLPRPPAVFTLDTGRLHPATCRFIDRVRTHYGIGIEFLCPDAKSIEALTSAKGLFSFYRDGHEECCGIRKVAPLRRKLATLEAWITGQRRDQGATRSNVPVIQRDPRFATATRPLVKINPLANWNSAEVWNYIRAFDVPHNELHDQGYVSIGCEPCTRPIGPHQQEREGRWWWEPDATKECGLHVANPEDAD